MGDPKRDDTDAEPWLTTEQAATMLGLKREGVKSLVFRKKLTPDYRGGQGGLRGHRFRLSTIQKFLRKDPA